MSILTIRAHKRFAVCRTASLRKPDKRSDQQALLIELSLLGCRVSNLDPRAFALEQEVSLRVDGAQPLDARVRWLGDGTVGLRFLRPLRSAALDQLVRLCRGEGEAPVPVHVPIASYAT